MSRQDESYRNPRDAEHLQTFIEYVYGFSCRTEAPDATARYGYVVIHNGDDLEKLKFVTNPLPYFTPEGVVI